ncbi:MAG TPA: serine/threonine-protein kinase [Urbifossiella sp.]
MNPRASLKPPAAANTDDALLDRIAREMSDRWRRGERPLAESFLDRFPELWNQPDDVLELIAEELALRADYDCPIASFELVGRFPQWAEQVRALLDCQRFLGPQLSSPRFPDAGETLGGFTLVSELGRGNHGRVFLAAQSSLAERPVVLKIGPSLGTEHLSLARLQHSHIVPLYSAHEFPERGLRALCLPYFGGATLAEILTRIKKVPSAAGRDLLGALGAEDSAAPGPARGFLAHASFEDAVCWIGACLADALQYAHDRQVLHLDIKPSNVLLAADGVPMLLDFHLARGPLRIGDRPPAWLGGTPGYMAPEQSFALDAVREGRTIANEVDGRADIYALGILLREMLAGQGITSGLNDILNRCTALLASQRYSTAADLAADLRRQLGDLPLKGVRNRSLAERLRKWRRRLPYALPLALALAALAVACGAILLHSNRVAERAQTAQQTAADYLAHGQYEEAAEAYRGGESLLDGLPFHARLRQQLHAGRQTAERARTAIELHAFCERIRPLYDFGAISTQQAHRVVDRCRELWDRRDGLVEKLSGQPTPALERQWRADLIDVAILTSCLEERAASGDEANRVHQIALATLTEAEKLFGASPALLVERARHSKALGRDDLAEEAERRRQTIPASSSWDHLAVGRSEFAAGNIERAGIEFDRCLRSDPQNFWAYYYKGLCELKRKRSLEAIAAFSASCALAPDLAWCRYNRGLAYIEAERFDMALADFDRALELDAALAECYLGRSTVHYRSGRSPEALADLDRALAGGIAPAEVLYRKALVLNTAGDRAAAIANLRDCLKIDPAHSDAKELLGRFNVKQ